MKLSIYAYSKALPNQLTLTIYAYNKALPMKIYINHS